MAAAEAKAAAALANLEVLQQQQQQEMRDAQEVVARAAREAEAVRAAALQELERAAAAKAEAEAAASKKRRRDQFIEDVQQIINEEDADDEQMRKRLHATLGPDPDAAPKPHPYLWLPPINERMLSIMTRIELAAEALHRGCTPKPHDTQAVLMEMVREARDAQRNASA